jgi:DNA-binding CsgD family transcriptional regulator
VSQTSSILDSNQVAEGVKLLVPLLETWESALDFNEKLFDALTSLIPAQLTYATASFRADQYKEEFEYVRPKEYAYPTTYTSVLYMLDPLRPFVTNQDFGVHTLAEVMPDGFEESEYYRLIYKNADLLDEMIFVLPITPSPPAETAEAEGERNMGTLVIGLARLEHEGKFSALDIKMARALHPILCACADQVVSTARGENLKEGRAHPRELQELLQLFVTDKLTTREGQVIGLVLCGHNTESVSVQLGIACDTVKLHRKHSYAKLRVNSQGELFKQFLDFLASSGDFDELNWPQDGPATP